MGRQTRKSKWNPVAAIALALALAGCSSGSDDDAQTPSVDSAIPFDSASDQVVFDTAIADEPDQSATAIDTGIDAGPDVASAAACDPTHEPSADPCVIAEEYGVFVASVSIGNAGPGINGGDGGLDATLAASADATVTNSQPNPMTPASGTRNAPYATIQAGIAAAVASKKSRVYVCEGVYREEVLLDAAHDGISLYGGLDCGVGWQWSPTAITQVIAPSGVFALRVNGTTQAVAVEDMAFAAANAFGQDSAGSGNSSVAAFVSHESAGVSLRRVTLQAGMGADGSPGAAPATNWFSPTVNGLQGNSLNGAMGGAWKDCPCQWGDTTAGAGGIGNTDPSFGISGDGEAGTATPPAPAVLSRNGLGGIGENPSSMGCTAGNAGADGMARNDGGAGATGFGGVGAQGWLPNPGTAGATGNPGQGGGGGGGTSVNQYGVTIGGGAGGCGGCGGAGGLYGHGGGASIALLVLGADVAFDGVLITAVAGNGGAGGPAESGANGGYPGSSAGCVGGMGGGGAGGQGGGGGAGGVSVGVVYDSTSSVAVDPTSRYMLPPQSAIGGAGGAGGDGGAPGNPGAPGNRGAGGTVGKQLLGP